MSTNTSYTKYGNFSKDGTEFVIKRPDTPRPWINYLTNGRYCLLISQVASGYSFYLDCEKNRITRWAPQNYLYENPGRFLFIYDVETGKYWSVTKTRKKYYCRHGLGYTIIGSENFGVTTEITYFVPQDEPLEVWIVKIINKSGDRKILRTFPVVEWMLGDYFEDLSIRNIYALTYRGEYDYKNQIIYVYRTPWRNRIWPYICFMSSSLEVNSFDIDEEFFYGRQKNYEAPQAVISGRCNNTDRVTGVGMVGVLQHELRLSAGEEKIFCITIGISKNKAQIIKLVNKYRDVKTVIQIFENTKAHWKNTILNTVNVETPDKDFNLMVNIWLKYQIYMNNYWGRSATFYHEGGGEFGYRNTAQDAWAMVSLNPEYSKRILIKLTEHQRRTGQPLPGWSLETGPTTHTPPSDFPIWLPILATAYVKETGDVKILHKKVKYYDGGYSKLYEHIKRAVMFLLNVAKSKRGLPLIGTQDWNDAFDRTGILGKGESVWLGMGLCVALKHLQELADIIGDKQTVDKCRKNYEYMKNLINKYAWDGSWYIYAFNDYGEPVGSKKNKEGNIQLNAQTWAILAEIPDENKLEKILKIIDSELDTPYGPVLFKPAYTVYNPRIGRITTFAVGTKENAAIFSHAGAFKIMADLKLKRARQAYETFVKLLPLSRNKNIEVFKTEPYVLPEYLIGPGNPRYGEGAFTWLTGSADWLFVAATQWMIGVRPEINGLRVDPCLPPGWKKVKIIREIRNDVYHIEIKNKSGNGYSVKTVKLDGKSLKGDIIPIVNDGKEHKVEVTV
ncbi:MAG: hypothetical protein NZ928_02275 [Endomicrobia bacterium]|nr:hypothetical protein [Endomicrobiia bacterium]